MSLTAVLNTGFLDEVSKAFVTPPDRDPRLSPLAPWSPRPEVLSPPGPQWLTLEDVPSGRLHLRLERLTPRPTAAELEEVGRGLRLGDGG